MADKISSTIKTISKVGAVFAADRIHVNHKTQGVNSINNNETQIQDKFISVGINMVRNIYNHVSKGQNLLEMRNTRTLRKNCRSTNVNYSGNTKDEQQEETEIDSTETVTDPVAYAEFTTNNGWENYQIDDFFVMAISESFEIKNTKNTIGRQSKWPYC